MWNANPLARLRGNSYRHPSDMAAKQKSSPKDSTAGLGYEADPGKEETPAPICRERQRKDFRGLRGEYLTPTGGVQE